jgi:hypothetical protein
MLDKVDKNIRRIINYPNRNVRVFLCYKIKIPTGKMAKPYGDIL